MVAEVGISHRSEGGDGRSHAGVFQGVEAGLVDHGVGGVDASVHRSCGGGSLGEGGSQRLDGEAGRDVTSSSTAHAVSDDAELHGLVVEVLIDGADPPDVARGTGTEDDHFVTSKIVSPIWTRSPFFTRVGPSIRSPSIHTPLVEP